MPNTETADNRYFEDVREGEVLPEMVKLPATVDLFRYSAVTWNAHRIHFDDSFAKSEGHPGVLVHAHLHGAYLAELVTAWAGPAGRVLEFGWANRGKAVPGDRLTCNGKVVEVGSAEAADSVTIDVEERNQRGELCASGRAVVALRRRNR